MFGARGREKKEPTQLERVVRAKAGFISARW